MLQLITTKPGDKYRSIKNPRVYEALRKRGYSKARAAAISNAQRKKEYTLDQLEAYVCSPCYDPAIAQAIASNVPALPRLKGEQIAPGVTRIRGNLCNVHGRYGKCPGASAAPAKPAKGGKKPKGPKARKPVKTPEQRAAERQQQQAQNRQAVFSQLGIPEDAAGALSDLRAGQTVDDDGGLVKMGLAEQAQDGSYRLTSAGRALMEAANQGDAGRARDTISGARDRLTTRQGRQAAATGRQQAATQRRADAEAKRQQRAAERAQAAADKKPAKRGGSGGEKKPAAQAKPAKRAPIRKPSSSGGAPSVGGALPDTETNQGFLDGCGVFCSVCTRLWWVVIDDADNTWSVSPDRPA